MFLLKICFSVVLLNLILTVDSNQILDLSGNEWTAFSEINRTIIISAQVPGSIHTALLSNGIIKDPYYGRRDTEYSWIAFEGWTYEREFTVSKDLLNQSSILTFFGIDTVSTIILNGRIIGRTNNMYVTYRYLVNGFLFEKNLLQVLFDSPTRYCQNQSEIYLKRFGYIVPPKNLPDVQHGQNHQNFIRKEQCSFSWDWGPSFPTVGIWKDVRLEFSSNAFITDAKVKVTFNSKMKIWKVSYELFIESYAEKDYLFMYGFGRHMESRQLIVNKGPSHIFLGALEIHEDEISLWWPYGYGKQILYDALFRMVDLVTMETTTKSLKFGFRTVELIQEPIATSGGLSFYFKINSLPIFLKGANWIPADSFQERVSASVLQNLFQSAIDANINTLRVWGGGVFEQDIFYNLADKYGMIIWQDLMFAVALYPVNDEFLKSVKLEITTQVRRLHHHPCLISWSGNNENEAAIAQSWWDEVTQNKKQLIADYVKLYVQTVEPIITSEDDTRPFLVSSPSNGPESIKSGYISKNPQNPLYGDVHFYNYKNDCWNVSIFPNPRFASEYGYQSYPSLITLSAIGSLDELKWNSSLMYYRQHHADGNLEIENFIKMHFKMPSVRDEYQFFRMVIYLSQIVQATCVKYESEHYRRLRENLIHGEGHTMGALYWQLNDIWQAPSWSSIEYGGRWKMLHYYVKDFFAPTIISGYVQDHELHVYLVADHPKDNKAYILNVTAYSWLRFQTFWSKQILINVTDLQPSEVFRKQTSEICPIKDCFIKIYLFDLLTGFPISQTDVYITSFSDITFTNPQLKITQIERVNKTQYEITLSTVSPAAFVWLETEMSGRFSINGFNMVSSTAKVRYQSWGLSNVKALSSSIQVLSLYDAYHE